jgi:hypothetical protein
VQEHWLFNSQFVGQSIILDFTSTKLLFTLGYGYSGDEKQIAVAFIFPVDVGV